MALSQSAVERIFARMLARYGSAWSTKWQGVDIDAVKADWAAELDGLDYEQIVYGLRYLPIDWPPTVSWFRDQCLRMPREVPKQLKPPVFDPPEPVKRELERLRHMQAQRAPLAWAYELQEREKAGEVLTEWQRRSWREALASPVVRISGEFNPIPADALPPAMRSQA